MAIFSKLFSKIRAGSSSTSDWKEIEEALIASDLGAKSAAEIIEIAKKSKVDQIDESVMTSLQSWLSKNDREIAFNADRPTTVMIVGVNGTGKTTSTAKLVSYLKRENKSVLLAAADTFRAAAVDQLQTWGERLAVQVITGPANGDPASVAFDAVTRTKIEAIDYLIIDTAGRLHTKSDLMDELGKIRRVVEKVLPVDEVLLVVDATTGQNGIIQAKIFMESVAITGLILTKMDGSAKGGIALAIERETGVPIKFIGTGEGAEDLEVFSAEGYLNGLFR
ncbi:MAG: signal recognition particle-docking protein FtsY [Actinomycetales bacterium]|nr:MAG: signal recognition particle-docking protein FtsY [Actinomycetales bacterium]